ncbi:dihydrolipoamide acetyltransferase family protein [Actinorugispora endophytica]|uniref:Dihydrolipoamide acetyltransferase component of pyruvate dehydrogenase complex n=1 Tax=Actinorugispora endophytica TaxID=1605990 RepID=A0A4R6V146_9ACTN|nr:dihydrolipoamide acetyltransferase family protein [Actinorugispora endophytica]TDQ52388.1 pyruvate dehydrogenase E2 component (dihydrolipoamide acetyltransferase) [Actinorugispora endophytica]
MSAAGAVRDFPLPDLGEGLADAEVVRWLVAPGDAVAVDQPVAEVETAKAVVEVPCPYAGRVTALHGAEGDVIAVGSPLVSVDTAASDRRAGPRVPGAVVPEARSDGPAEPGGGGDGAAPGGSGSGAVLVGYGTSEGGRRRRTGRVLAPDGPGTTASGAPSASPARPGGRTPVVSPLVRRIAREHGVDVTALTGSGGGGLVLRRDVEAVLAYRRGARDAARGADTAPPKAAAPDRAERGDERVALRGARRAAADRFSRSRREIPEATVWVDADAGGLLAVRAALNAADPERPVSLLALLARFCVAGLRRFPALNSRVDSERSEIVRLARVNLGFAARTPRGLVVPVAHDAHAMTTRELSAALRGLTDSARAGTLAPADLTGGTFTVNNYGVFGVDGSAAIINHPEAAILGMGRIVKRPWVVDDELAVRPVTELTLAFDHRVCDGEEAGGFLRFVADLVERPELLLGEV